MNSKDTDARIEILEKQIRDHQAELDRLLEGRFRLVEVKDYSYHRFRIQRRVNGFDFTIADDIQDRDDAIAIYKLICKRKGQEPI